MSAQIRGFEAQMRHIFSEFVQFNSLFELQFPIFGKVENDAKNYGRDHVPDAPFGRGTLS